LIDRSQFKNLNSLKGGAVYIEESEDNKLSTDTYGKYRISGSTFDSCTAVAGGAIYLNNPQYLTVNGGCNFQNNKALNSSSDSLKNVRGSGGAIYYECDENALDCLVDIAFTTFSFNYAEIKGGAIHWNTLEPIFGGITSSGNFSSIKFNKNKAGRYGDNISAFAQQIAIIDEKDFTSTMFSATSFM
jgi:Chlamydia polymorphic membrane protein (Chlamydia_PMP) repeat